MRLVDPGLRVRLPAHRRLPAVHARRRPHLPGAGGDPGAAAAEPRRRLLPLLHRHPRRPPLQHRPVRRGHADGLRRVADHAGHGAAAALAPPRVRRGHPVRDPVLRLLVDADPTYPGGIYGEQAGDGRVGGRTAGGPAGLRLTAGIRCSPGVRLPAGAGCPPGVRADPGVRRRTAGLRRPRVRRARRARRVRRSGRRRVRRARPWLRCTCRVRRARRVRRAAGLPAGHLAPCR